MRLGPQEVSKTTVRLRISLEAAWQALLLLVAVVPMAVLLSWAGGRVFDLLVESRLAREAEANLRLREHISHEVRRLVTLAENKSDAMSMVRRGGRWQGPAEPAPQDSDVERIFGLMDNIVSREPAVVAVVLTDADGEVLAGLYRAVGQTARQEHAAPPGSLFDWGEGEPPAAVTVPLGGEPFVGSPTLDDGAPTFLVSSPVAAGGALLVQVDVATLWSGRSLSESGSGAVTYAVDRAGVLLHAPSWVNRPPGTPLTSVAGVAALRDDSITRTVGRYEGLGGEPVFGISGTIGQVGWGLVTEIPVAEIVSPVRAMLTRIAGIVALVCLAFAGLGAVLVGRILRPVSALSERFARATAGDYRRLESDTVIHEIRQLTRGFNTMLAVVGHRESQLVEAQRIARMGHWEWTVGTGELTWSDQIFQIFGLDPEQTHIDYERFLESVHPDDRPHVLAAIDATIDFDVRAPYSVDHRITLPDGGVRIVHEQAEVTFDPDTRRAVRLLGTVQDITERTRVEEERNAFNRTLQAILDNSPFGIWLTDPEGRPQFANEPLCRKIGRRPEEVLAARHIGEFFDQQILEEFSASQRRGAGDSRMRSIYTALNLSGRSERDLKVTRATIHDGAGDIQGFIGIVEDVTEARKLEAQIAHQATHDSLTGLLNRAAFEEKLEQVCRTIGENDTPHAVCFIDLDRFKVVNDTCGHHAGDELLRQLTSLFRTQCRKTELVHGPEGEVLAPALARLGGDEFGLLLYNCPPEHAEVTAQRLVDVTAEFRFTYEGQVFDVGCTIGIAPILFGNAGAEELMKQADGACYVAKEKGRGRIHMFRPGDAEVDRHHGSAQWASLITRALEENGLELFQQPICPVGRREQGDRFEVLVRYRSRAGEVVPPGAFLPAAERYYLMPRVDLWVVRNTFEALERAYGGGREDQLVSASINLSGQTLGEGALLDLVVECLDRSSLRPEQICFEITETAAVSNLEEAIYLIDRLRELGCRFALDDFGSGLSSFSYLSAMQVDYLKIDGSLVRNIVDDPVAREMVSAIKRVGDVMDIRTVGEWVEDDAILQVLQELGVDFAQGYGLARPEPLDSLAGGRCDSEVPAAR